MIENILHDCYINYNCLNLFQNNLKELNFSKNNPNNFEIIKLKSSIDFNLSGIGIPKIPEKDKNSIEVKIYKGNALLEEITNFNNYDNLSIGILNSKLIKIEKNIEYSIEIKGITGLDYINNEEIYNDKTKIEISSNNSETELACLIIA